MVRIKERKESKRKAEIVFKLSSFEIPPMHDGLVIGKKASVGMEAAKRMADAVSPEQLEIIPVKDKIVEAILLKKSLLQLIPQKQLVSLILEESKRLMTEEGIIKIDIDISISIIREISL